MSAEGCPLCGALERRLLLRKNGYEIVACGACGVGAVAPLPTPEQLAALYNEDAREGLTHTVAFERYVGAQRSDHQALARRVMDVVEGRCALRTAAVERLLDVGCAAGFLLDEARRRGWEVSGVELSRDLGEYAQSRFGLPVFVGELRDAPWPPASFNVVTVIGTLEHVPDPRELLADCGRRLAPGGLLVVLTENLENQIVRCWPSAWNGFMPPEHLYHFTPGSLRRLLAELGVTVETIVPLRSQLRAAIGGLAPASVSGAGKRALDSPATDLSSRLFRAAYRLVDGAWRRWGVTDRMIVLGRI